MIDFLDLVNGVLWHEAVLYVVLATGVLFTVWSGFGQYRALTHGVQVIRGKYDDKDDPGAINHFQALSTALSATVGLGNIAGVAIAISLGGPGAVFWMWVVGLVGMALKMTEVTQALLFRNVSDPDNPHGGAMWVCKKGFEKISPALAPIGAAVGAVFCVTLLVSTVTGGNMFQAWNVADIYHEYFGVPKLFTGLILAVGVGLVIIGGIKRIGDVAGRVVPLMCGLYLLVGIGIILMNLDRVPAMFALIFSEAFSPSEATGAFVGGTAAFGFLKGMQRALFSNEAGQGSAPIAHSAAKTDEPVREGIVAGLEPFIDTLCVCTVTALVILLSGTWNRAPALVFDGGQPAVEQLADGRWQFASSFVTVKDALEADASQMRDGKDVFLVVTGGPNVETGGQSHRVEGTLTVGTNGRHTVDFLPITIDGKPIPSVDGVYLGFKGATLTAKAFDRAAPGLGKWVVPMTALLFAFSTMISWSYYGEQGIVYLFAGRGVMAYRVVYCLLILVATSPLIRTEGELDVISTLGTGVMLWANIPIMLLFGGIAMRAYKDYMGRLDRGELIGHAYPKISDVIDGDDVE